MMCKHINFEICHFHSVREKLNKDIRSIPTKYIAYLTLKSVILKWWKITKILRKILWFWSNILEVFSGYSLFFMYLFIFFNFFSSFIFFLFSRSFFSSFTSSGCLALWHRRINLAKSLISGLFSPWKILAKPYGVSESVRVSGFIFSLAAVYRGHVVTSYNKVLVIK